MKMDSYDWIISVCCSESEGIRIMRYRGTTEEMKQKIVDLVLEDKTNDEENYEYGSETIDDVTNMDGLSYELYGYAVYKEYHIDYMAKEFAHVDMI